MSRSRPTGGEGPWRWFLGLGLGAVLAGAFLPVLPRQGLYAVVGIASLTAIVVGIRRYRPARPRVWWLFAAAVGCTVLGAVAWGIDYGLTGEVGFPAWKDALFLAGYPLIGAGLTTWVRRDPTRPRWEGLVDSGIVASGVAALSWTFIVHPLLTDGRHDAPHVFSYLTYAVIDLVLVVLAARLAFSSGARTVAYLAVVGATMALLLGDCVYYIGLAWTGATVGDGFSAALWIIAYLLLGAGALHPSMVRSAGQVEWSQQISSNLRLGMYGLLTLIGPVIAVVFLPGPGRHDWLVVPLVTTAVTSVLLTVRLGLLVRVAHRRAAELDTRTHALSTALRDQEGLRQQLTHRALHDALTGLGNRALLHERLEHAFTRRSTGHGLLLLDLDGFKDVNDSFGHPVGDALLIEVAARLLGVVDGADTLVRLGGDEFAILLEDVSEKRVAEVGRAVVAAIREPFVIADRELSVTTSVGSLLVRPPSTTAEALRNVDLALYAAKGAGKNQLAAYEPRLGTERREHMRLTTELRRAVAREEFTVNYQPVVDLTTGRVTAVEALIRWSPDGVPVPPDEFIPIAEQCGLIVPIGEWVLRQACRDARAWYERYGIAVTVNVSGRQLREPGFAVTVVNAMHDAGLPGEALILEITETVLVASTGTETDVVTTLLSALRAEGVRIAVDDFGTGYSSLAYLRHLPVDILKIDRAFTPEGGDGTAAGLAEEMAFTRAILELGSSLHLQSIAEAVETPEQAQRLRQLHCPLAQGYHFSRPLPAGRLDEVLADGDGHLAGEPLISAVAEQT